MVVLSATHEPEQVRVGVRGRRIGVLREDGGQDDLMAAIRQAFETSIYLVALRQRIRSTRAVECCGEAPELTRREIEILQLVAEGHSNSQLARMLWVTEQTVKFHLSNIYRKLDVANRTEASRWAQLHGLLPETRSPSTAA